MIVTRGCRTVRSSHMVRHGVLGEVVVSADGEAVTWRGSPLRCSPIDTAPLSRVHYW
jgi:urease alpha subunit